MELQFGLNRCLLCEAVVNTFTVEDTSALERSCKGSPQLLRLESPRSTTNRQLKNLK